MEYLRWLFIAVAVVLFGLYAVDSVTLKIFS